MFSYQDTKKNPNVLSLWLALRFVLKTSGSGKVSLNKESIRHFQNSHMFAWYAKINF